MKKYILLSNDRVTMAIRCGGSSSSLDKANVKQRFEDLMWEFQWFQVFIEFFRNWENVIVFPTFEAISGKFSFQKP